MRAEGAVGYFQHNGFDIYDLNCPNDDLAFITDDVGRVATDPHKETTAALDPQRLVREDWQPVVHIVDRTLIAIHS